MHYHACSDAGLGRPARYLWDDGCQNGPRHSSSGLILGSLWDFETQGQPSAAANGDDLATTDDEDGVTRNLSHCGPRRCG